MNKTNAIQLLGGSIAAAAKTMGISYHAVHKWPDMLTDRIAQRVHGVLAMQKTRKNKTLSA